MGGGGGGRSGQGKLPQNLLASNYLMGAWFTNGGGWEERSGEITSKLVGFKLFDGGMIYQWGGGGWEERSGEITPKLIGSKLSDGGIFPWNIKFGSQMSIANCQFRV